MFEPTRLWIEALSILRHVICLDDGLLNSIRTVICFFQKLNKNTILDKFKRRRSSVVALLESYPKCQGSESRLRHT